MIVNRGEWSGVEFVTFVLANDSFAYVEGKWVVFKTTVAGVDLPWRGGYMTEFGGEFFCAYNNEIGKLARINTDYGEIFRRKLGVPFQHPDNADFTMGALKIVSPQGFDSDGSIGLRLSDDNVLFGITLYESAAPTGQYANALEWNYPGGLGYYWGFAGVELVCDTDMYFALQELVIDLA